MKIAIIGDSPISLIYGEYFQSLGANAHIYAQDFCLDQLYYCLGEWKDWKDELASVLPHFGSGEAQTIVDFLNCTKQKLSAFGLIKEYEVLRIHKCFLACGKEPFEGSRLSDLFRVVFNVNPSEGLLEQKESSPETFKNFSKEFMSSLSRPHENYQDYDLIIEINDGFKLDATLNFTEALALGESQKMDMPKYSKSFPSSNQEDGESITLVGDTVKSAYWLLSLNSWLKNNQKNNVNIVCLETSAFSNLKKNSKNVLLKNKLDDFFRYWQKDYHDKREEFEKKLYEFRTTDDPVKKRKGPPQEPIEKISFYGGYNILSFDKLDDNESLFLTLEPSPFSLDHQNLNVITLGSDYIINCNESSSSYYIHRFDRISNTLTSEPGFYFFNFNLELSEQLKRGCQEIKVIRNDLDKYFSKRENID